MTATRRTAREWAIQMLTAADLNPPADIPTFISDFWNQISDLESDEGGEVKPSKGLRNFAEERVQGVLGELKEIDEILVKLLDNWDLYRLGTIERTVLRLGIWELKEKSKEIPTAVVINEAIDLSNWFSSPKSRSLINGVLDKYAKGV